MRIGYTEFSFGYAFTENLLRSIAFAVNGAPVFPNLKQEATAGYDIQINLPGVPLFFQYKLPELMVREAAFEISQYELLDLGIPFFRMPLMRRDLSGQHQILIDLENNYPGMVYYATPCLRDIHEFNTSYNAASIHLRSTFFSPAEIGPLPDDQNHSVSYAEGLAHGYFCSEPKRVVARKYGDVATKIESLFHTDVFQSLQFASRIIRNSIREIVSPAMKDNEYSIEGHVTNRRGAAPESARADVDQTVTNILVAREMARVDLGVDLLIAQPRA